MLPLLWVASAIAIATAAIRSKRHPSAIRIGRLGVGFLYIVAGAGANAWMLASGEDYRDFAKASYIPFVRDTWESLVVPNHDVWISLLIVFEFAVGALALAGAKRTQLAYVLAIAFHICLLSFGWGFYLWSVPMIAAFITLLRAERRAEANPRGNVI